MTNKNHSRSNTSTSINIHKQTIKVKGNTLNFERNKLKMVLNIVLVKFLTNITTIKYSFVLHLVKYLPEFSIEY